MCLVVAQLVGVAGAWDNSIAFECLSEQNVVVTMASTVRYL